ncbi:MAG: YjgP/YjgQ family permease [Candidatus Kapaibacterium sp.]|nr:MAG: YjgP/YjgQ family permease [Candidatus Kapabacteria bacterium]
MLLSLYILRAHTGPFLFGTLTVAFVFLLNFLIVFLPQIVGKGLTLWVIIQLIALNMAWIVTIAVPLGILVATLMAFGNLSSTNEITMIRAGGASLLQMMFSPILLGLVLSAGVYWFNDEILPEANHRALTLRMDIERKKPTFVLDKGQFSTQLDGYSILSRALDTTQGMMLGVTIYDNTKFDQMSVLSADTGFINFSSDYRKVVLMLKSGELHQLNQQNPADYRRVSFSKHRVLMDASGFDFSRTDASLTSRGDRTMKIRDMQKVVQESLENSAQSRERVKTMIATHTNEISRTQVIAAKKDSLKAAPLPASELRTIPLAETKSTIATSVLPAPKRSPKRKRLAKLIKTSPAPSLTGNLTSSSTATLPAPKPLTRREAAWRAESRITGMFSTLDNDVFSIRDRELNADKYVVEIHKKYVIPLACFVFVLIGCPLGIVTKRGNLGVSGLITIGFYVVYWALLMTGERFADRGLIEPRLAMWQADITLALVGVFLIVRVGRDLPIVNAAPLYRLWRRLFSRKNTSNL